MSQFANGMRLIASTQSAQNGTPHNISYSSFDGSGRGPINNLTFLSTLSDCAPSRRALASASVIGKKEMGIDQVVELANQQLRTWFGESVKKYFFSGLIVLVMQYPIVRSFLIWKPRKNGVYRCGDYLGLPSIDSAGAQGRLVAESIITSNQE